MPLLTDRAGNASVRNPFNFFFLFLFIIQNVYTLCFQIVLLHDPIPVIQTKKKQTNKQRNKQTNEQNAILLAEKYTHTYTPHSPPTHHTHTTHTPHIHLPHTPPHINLYKNRKQERQIQTTSKHNKTKQKQ